MRRAKVAGLGYKLAGVTSCYSRSNGREVDRKDDEGYTRGTCVRIRSDKMV